MPESKPTFIAARIDETAANPRPLHARTRGEEGGVTFGAHQYRPHPEARPRSRDGRREAPLEQLLALRPGSRPLAAAAGDPSHSNTQ
jgi:hypothetical protein